MLIVQVLGRPHLMLADSRANNSLSLRDSVEALQHVMWLNEIALTVVVQRVILLQRLHMFDPRRKVLLEPATGRQEIFESRASIGYVRPGDLLDLSDFRRVDIEMGDVHGIR